MYQYDDATAVSTRPAATGMGTPGFFTDGDPVGGEEATILRAEFTNMVMMELVNLVTSVGLTLSKTDSTQVRQAIQSMVTGAQSAIVFTGVTFATGVANGNVVRWDNVAGNYTKVRAALWPRATAFVWMDLERGTVMRQVIWRSFHRALTKTELWPGTGNTEMFRRWLEKEHPIEILNQPDD